MNFIITDRYTFWWPVTVSIPSEKKPGKIEKQTFQMQFEALSKEDAEALDKELNDATESAHEDRLIEVIQRISCDWRDVVDEAGDEVAFSSEALGQAMRFTWFKKGVLDAYSGAMAGQGARAKN